MTGPCAKSFDTTMWCLEEEGPENCGDKMNTWIKCLKKHPEWKSLWYDALFNENDDEKDGEINDEISKTSSEKTSAQKTSDSISTSKNQKLYENEQKPEEIGQGNDTNAQFWNQMAVEQKIEMCGEPCKSELKGPCADLFLKMLSCFHECDKGSSIDCDVKVRRYEMCLRANPQWLSKFTATARTEYF